MYAYFFFKTFSCISIFYENSSVNFSRFLFVSSNFVCRETPTWKCSRYFCKIQNDFNIHLRVVKTWPFSFFNKILNVLAFSCCTVFIGKQKNCKTFFQYLLRPMVVAKIKNIFKKIVRRTKSYVSFYKYAQTISAFLWVKIIDSTI